MQGGPGLVPGMVAVVISVPLCSCTYIVLPETKKTSAWLSESMLATAPKLPAPLPELVHSVAPVWEKTLLPRMISWVPSWSMSAAMGVFQEFVMPVSVATVAAILAVEHRDVPDDLGLAVGV